MFADEQIYFLTQRMPPVGLELSYTHKIDLGPKENALLHIIPDAELKREVKSGIFASAYSCDDDEIGDYRAQCIAAVAREHRAELRG